MSSRPRGIRVGKHGFSNPHLVLFLLFFLLSGAAGLIYQIVWARLLELYFGVTMVAITLIVAAYMGGLGLGSLFGGRIARRLAHPLLAYGLVEIGIGIFGLISPALIGWVGQMTAGISYVFVFILSFALLLIPTFLMGMTLPLLSQAFIDRVETVGRVIGLLYGINTLGAAIGALMAGYVFIGWHGFDGAILWAVLLNASVGIGAVLLIKWRPEVKSVEIASQQPSPKVEMLWVYHTILLASFLVGFIGLGYEMLWIRMLSVINKNTAYGFPTILSVFLVGLGIGGYFWGRKADQTSNTVRLFWKLELGVGIIAALGFFFFWVTLNPDLTIPWLKNFISFQKPISPIVSLDGQNIFSKQLFLFGLLEYLLPIILLVLPTSMIMGGGLIILDRIAINSPEVAGRRVGDVHLANILGSVCGTLAISFVFLPLFGSELTSKILVLLSLVFPVLYLLSRKIAQENGKPGLSLAFLSLVIIFMTTILPGRGQFYTRLFEVASYRQALTTESGDSVLTFTFNRDTGQPEWLWIGGEINSFFPANGTYENRALACAGASHPKRILIIGIGGGNTAYFLTTLPGVEEIVIVELLGKLGPFLKESLPTAEIMLNDERVRYLVDDGRRYLYAHPDEKFDLISIDPLRMYTAGHNNLYSIEAMELYRSHLAEGGVLCAWEDHQNVIPHTIASVFPEVDQFLLEFVVASNQPIYYDLAYMQTSAENYMLSAANYIAPETAEAMVPERIFAWFLRDQAQIIADEQEAPILTDLRPWLEYYYFNPQAEGPVHSHNLAQQSFLQRINGCDAACQERISASWTK